MIGTQKTLGVSAPGSAMVFVIASPVGPYYPTGFKAVSLEATDYAVRAWPGGVGDKKLGANYAPCIVPQLEAGSRGFQQNLWLFGKEQYLTEVGTMNLFLAMKNKETGQNELITPPLDGTILEGVTRDSVLTLARERLAPKGWKVSERKITMPEIAQAADEGRLIEVFGAGTAAIVSPVRNISWNGRLVDCGLKKDEEAGKVALEMKNWIEGIQYGDEEHPWRSVTLPFSKPVRRKLTDSQRQTLNFFHLLLTVDVKVHPGTINRFVPYLGGFFKRIQIALQFRDHSLFQASYQKNR